MNLLFDSVLYSLWALTLAHFIWQGLLIGAAAWLAGLGLRGAGSAARYRLYLTALLAMAACPPLTLAWLEHAERQHGDLVVAASQRYSVPAAAPTNPVGTLNNAAEPAGLAPVLDSPLSAQPAGDWKGMAADDGQRLAAIPPASDRITLWQRSAPGLTVVYFGGVLVMLLRLTLGLRGGRRLQRASQQVTDQGLAKLLSRRAAALGLRRVPMLAWSHCVAVPTVVGVLRPAILLPISLHTGLTLDQLAGILTHELAHIRRWDPLVNVLQRVIEAVLFFHPAVWLISRRIRQEREHCCDDLVLATGADAVGYAWSLVDIAQRAAGQPPAALPALATLRADGRPSELAGRVHRLLGQQQHESIRLQRPGWLWTGVLALVALIALSRLVVVAQDEPLAEQTPVEKAAIPARAVLPDGIVVELVGVAFHPSQDRPWWKPDGSELTTRPYEQSPGTVMPGSPKQADCREFLIEIQGLPKEHAIRTDYGRSAATGSVFSKGRWIGEHAAGPFESATTSIKVGLTTEPLGPVQTIDVQGRKSESVDAATDVVSLYEQVVPLRVEEESPGRTVIVFDGTKLQGNRDRADWTIQAIDLDGQPQRSTFEYGKATESHIGFPIPLSRIARFEYRLRPYRYWVTFDNVSLLPGQRTDVKVRVQADRYIAKLPNGAAVELVGITRNGAPSDEGWKPNGEPIGKVAEWPDKTIITRGRNTTILGGSGQPDPGARDLLVEVTGLRNQPAFKLLDYRGAAGWSNLPAAQPYRNRLSILPTEPNSVMDIRLGFTDDPWGPYQQVGLSGEMINEIIPAEPYHAHYREIEVVRVGPETDQPANVELVLQMPENAQERFEFQVRCIDTAGEQQAVIVTRRTGAGTEHWRTELPADRLARFEYRLRPFRDWITFRNVAMEPDQQTQVEVKIESTTSVSRTDFAKNVVAAAIPQLPFANHEHRQRTAAEFQELVEKYSSEPLSVDFVQAVASSLSRHISLHFPAGPSVDDPQLRDRYYLQLQGLIRELQWRLFVALRRPPLSESEKIRLAKQHQWMREYIQARPPGPSRPGERDDESLHRQRIAEELSQLEDKINDPLSLVFYEPLSDEQFATLQQQVEQIRFSDRAAGEAFWYLVGLTAQMQFGEQTEKRDMLELKTFTGRSPRVSAANGHIGIWFPGQMRLANVIRDFRSQDSFISLGQPHRIVPMNRDTTTARTWTPAEIDPQDAADQGPAHLIFDEQPMQLIGLAGTRIAPLTQRWFFELDATTTQALVAHVESTGNRIWNLPKPNAAASKDQSEFGVLAAALTSDGRLFVLQPKQQGSDGLLLWIRQHER